MDYISSNNPSLEIIIGSMYAGKSSELLRRLIIYLEMGFKVCYINSVLDTRTDTNVSTHNPSLNTNTIFNNFISMKTQNLKDVCIDQFDVIGIDESQFFTDLKTTVIEWVENKHKKVVIAGLSGDCKRNVFGQTLELIPFCDSITKLNPFCKPCSKKCPKEVVPAPFTKRIEEGSVNQIDVGGKEKYIPVCRKCFK